MQESFQYLFKEKVVKSHEEETLISEREALDREELSFKRGYDKARKELLELNTKKQADDYKYSTLLNGIREELDKLIAGSYSEKEKQGLLNLALAIGEKLSGVIVGDNYCAKIKDFVFSVMLELQKNLSIKVRVNSGLAENLKSILKDLNCSVFGEESVQLGDCIVEWENGKAEDILQDRKHEIKKILFGEV